MAHITVPNVQAWLEPTKSTLNALDSELEAQVSTQVLAQAAQAYTTSGWVNDATTPSLIRTVIAMYYASWYIDRTFSADNEQLNAYAVLLRGEADQLLADITSGVVDLDDVPGGSALAAGVPVFYPNDASSDPSLVSSGVDSSAGGPYFQMGTIW